MEVLSPQRRVRSLPPAAVVAHLHEVRQKDVVVRAGIAGPRGGMAGVGIDEASCRARLGGSSSSAAHLSGNPVEVAEGGVSLGIHDLVHVLGPADDA